MVRERELVFSLVVKNNVLCMKGRRFKNLDGIFYRYL
jgi:hypothetical protein